jgi:hypothetical protein
MVIRRPLARLRAVVYASACIALSAAAPAFAQSPGDPPPPSPASPAPPSTPWYRTVSLNGLVSASYVENFDAPPSRKNAFRVFDADSSTFKLDVVELVLQRAVSKPGDAGFRADLTFGSSVSRVTAAAGLFRDEAGEAGDFDIHQAVASYIVPVGRGLRVDAGKFLTHIGYEVIEGYDGYNDNHSRGLVFGYAEPITHTGVKLSYPLSDAVSAQLMYSNGWDDAVDNNSGKSVGLQLALTPGPRFSFTANYMGGPEQKDNDDHMRHLADFIAIAKVLPAVTLVANYDYGREAAVPLPETAGGEIKDATWQGLAGYARFTASPKLAFTVRGEWFDDPQGARTGYVQTLHEFTFTPEFRFHPSFVLRGDLRRDDSSAHVFERGDGTFGQSQTTASVNVLFVF